LNKKWENRIEQKPNKTFFSGNRITNRKWGKPNKRKEFIF
jgi:hypothetical protein